MHEHTLARIDVGVELVVLPLLVLATVGYIEHVLTHAGLTVGTLAEDIDHPASDGTNDLLVIFQQRTIRFTVDALAHRQVRNNNEGKFLIRERIVFHSDEGIAYPSSHDRTYNPRTINIPKSPILIYNKLFTGFVTEVEIL